MFLDENRELVSFSHGQHWTPEAVNPRRRLTPLGSLCLYDFAAAEGKQSVRLREAPVAAHAALANTG